MARRIPIYQVLQLVEMADNVNDKVQILRENRDVHLERVLLAALDDRVEWLLPRGQIPFNPCDQPRMEFALEQETRTFYLYLKDGGAPETLTEARRNQLFINLLEGIHPKDAEILIAAKDKYLPYPSVTKELVNLAYKSGSQDWLYIDTTKASDGLPEKGSITEKYKRFLDGAFPKSVPSKAETGTVKKKRGRPSKKDKEVELAASVSVEENNG